MKTNHVILYTDKKLATTYRASGPVPENLSFKLKPNTLQGSSKINIAIEEMDSGKTSDLYNRNSDVIAIAPIMPLKLIQPINKPLKVTDSKIKDELWNIEAVAASKSEFNGAGIRIAILDTGIDSKHIAFKGMKLHEKDFTGEGNGDIEGHGTHCAGVAFGRDIKGRRIGIANASDDALIAKVLGVNGGGSDILVNAINWAVNSGANIISMSLGIDFPGYAAQLEMDGMHKEAAISSALDGYRKNILLFESLANLVRVQSQNKFTQPVIIIAASGNESSRPQYRINVSPPAVSEGIISVGAVGKEKSNLYVAPFSNMDPTLCAPGVDIISAEANTNGLISLDGTSMATPHVAGIAALWAEKLLKKNQFNANTLYSNITVACKDDKLKKEDADDYGVGIVQAPFR
ncbi:S8 family peptidase [Pedobacter insulae]|uniref:Subtilase family protein n=1 Tax=Pedobacter insulae TaxID=414048 RepID=A0A1I2ZGT8_9SPHI|nr:S8 family serine peptidase [Pedobacter insulae]SFH36940.1 Subtilase family protein [Pedobacter insulae]